MAEAITLKNNLQSPYTQTQKQNATNVQNSTQNLIFPEQTNTKDPKEITAEKTAENIPKEKENGSFWTKVKTKVKNLFKKSKENVAAFRNKEKTASSEKSEMRNAVPEEVYLVNGKPANGMHNGILYMKGLKANGYINRIIYQDGIPATKLGHQNITQLRNAVFDQFLSENSPEETQQKLTKFLTGSSKTTYKSGKITYTKDVNVALPEGDNTKDVQLKIVISEHEGLLNFEGNSKTRDNGKGVKACETFQYDETTGKWKYDRSVYKLENGKYVLDNSISTGNY